MVKIIFGLAVLFTSFFMFVNSPPVLAAAPDGSGPWADSVVSTNQGLTLNGQPVSSFYPLRSNPSSALGVAENDTTEGNFYSLGFGGSMVLQFDNPISNGVVLVEATNPEYPFARVQVELSDDNLIWHYAGTVVQDGYVAMPRTVSCARYVRLTDISHPANFADPDADGYDVDGVMATDGTSCGGSGVTPSPTLTGTIVPTPTDVPDDSSASSNDGGNRGAPICPDLKPGTPTLIAVSYKNSTTAVLDWTKVPGANNYMISYGLQTGNYIYGVAQTGDVTHYEVGNLAPNVKYYFIVYALNNCQPSDPTSELSSDPGPITGYGIGGAEPTVLADTGDSVTTITDVSVGTLAAISLGYLLKKRFI